MRAPLTFARALTSGNVRLVRNAASPELWIYDEIGFWGVTASDVARDLAAVAGQRVTVRVNSPGGEVFDGIAIYNLLRAHVGGVDVVIDGLAASAASFIAMAGEKVTMAPNARMMIHDAIGMCFGNAADMLETAALLDDLSGNIAAIYDERTGDAGGGPDAWRQRMKAESWLTPEQALELGLVDEIGIPASSGEPAAGTPDPATDPAAGGGDELVDRYRASMTFKFAEAGKERTAAGAPRTPARPAPRGTAGLRPAARLTGRPRAFATALTAADGEFLDSMLEHFACSTGAARSYLAVGEDNRTQDVSDLATTVLTTQTSQIMQMQDWLTAAGVAPEAPEGPDAMDKTRTPSVVPDGAAIARMIKEIRK